MKTYLQLTVTALVLFVTQACSTSGGGQSEEAGSATTVAAPAVSGGRPADDFVPAVVGIPADPGPSRNYRIGPFDLLRIEVFQVDELSSEERVNEDGLVAMPLIGAVKVGGLTPSQAEQAIADKLGRNYLQDPQVNIFVTEYASQKVTVTGHVKKPGVFPVQGETTLMQAIALAGGLDDVAKKEEILIFRKQAGGDVNAYVVDLSAIEEGSLTDPVVVGEDRVVVPESGVAVFRRAVGRILTGWVLRAPVY
jgi:polysaccharide export outer membrane protein